ncbi:hypothetical protein [Geothrix campi]|uniref:hypothetical protein n=1 Tax=Geothrix campi TaxID=2966450 RepID=UPI00214998B7|nr:hypothetical protein [Geothrix sp. SG10]
MTGVVTNTFYTPDDIQPLVQSSDGRMVPAGSQSMLPATQGGNLPTYPQSVPGNSWMTQESIIPGLRNVTVLLGAGIAALGIWFMVRKASHKVIA